MESTKKPVQGVLPPDRAWGVLGIARKPSSLTRRARPLLALSDRVRSMGIHLVAGRGAGKSRLMGRGIAFQDFISGRAVVIFDPHGTTIDNFLDRLCYLSPEQQQRLAPRILYIDMSGKLGYVPGFPLYYRLPGDTLREVAQRFPNLISKLNPNLARAPVLGETAVNLVGTNLGMVLAALGLQITDGISILTEPKRWEARLRKLAEDDLEAKPAADYFLYEYLPMDERERRMEIRSFLSASLNFTHDAALKVMFGSGAQTVDWRQAIEDKAAILLDFRHILNDPQQVRFKMLWVLSTFQEYARGRGATRDHPVSVLVDELSFLLSLNASGHDLLSADLDELINKTARNNNIWLTLAHQEMHQLPEPIQRNLMGMGTQVIGITSNHETALMLAKMYHQYNPYWIRKVEPVREYGVVIDHTSVEFTPEEQWVRMSYLFRQLGPGQFFVAATSAEGTLSTRLRRITTSGLDIGQYPDQEWLAPLRERLLQRSCIEIAGGLRWMDERTRQILSPVHAAAPPEAATQSRDDAHPDSGFVRPPRSTRRRKGEADSAAQAAQSP